MSKTCEGYACKQMCKSNVNKRTWQWLAAFNCPRQGGQPAAQCLEAVTRLPDPLAVASSLHVVVAEEAPISSSPFAENTECKQEGSDALQTCVATVWSYEFKRRW